MDLNRRIDKLEDSIKEGVKIEQETLVRLTRLETNMEYLTQTIKTFVNHSQFEPVRLIAYGLATGVLTTVLGTVMLKMVGLLK